MKKLNKVAVSILSAALMTSCLTAITASAATNGLGYAVVNTYAGYSSLTNGSSSQRYGILNHIARDYLSNQFVASSSSEGIMPTTPNSGSTIYAYLPNYASSNYTRHGYGTLYNGTVPQSGVYDSGENHHPKQN